MIPSELQASSFRAFPPESQKFAARQVDLLRRMPVGVLSLLLREIIVYDWKFPAERKELDRQFTYLRTLSPVQFDEVLEPFARLRLNPELVRADWLNAPGVFCEQLSAHLWATHQIDQFRTAAIDYVQQSSGAPEPLPQQRLGIVVIGRGLAAIGYPLFRKLRPYGVYYKQVNSENAWNVIHNCIAARAAAHPEPHAHWCIDGSKSLRKDSGTTAVSYANLRPLRLRLQSRMQDSFEAGMGPEIQRTMLASLRPGDVGLQDDILNRFQLKLFTESSGTMLFSTMFVQWAAREAWRRAQPLTLLACFAPRQKEQSMKEMLTEARTSPALDPEGSLVDSDMGAFYTWLNQQRLSGADRALFIAWCEEHQEAVAIGPGLQRATESTAPLSFESLLG